ncbi:MULTISPECIES: hypothetical protein [unclassified Mesorhizobium]|uniref:hypothetical protein n=1 Tax=unclassified Mesorhizobium TaxID=325217 RepID=UPI0016726378|nr:MULTISPECIES: hypothetical protein [unclassified Mesorhizobium]
MASKDLDALTAAGVTALAAQDPSDKQITYVKAPFTSLAGLPVGTAKQREGRPKG